MFGEAVAQAAPGPGTIRTNAVETIDNDHVMAGLGVLSDPAPEPSPGTRITETIETVDDDEAASILPLLNADPEPQPDPRPQPGTTLTATVETTDEDTSALFGHLH